MLLCGDGQDIIVRSSINVQINFVVTINGWLRREWITSASDQTAAAAVVADINATWQHTYLVTLHMTLTTHNLVDIQHSPTYMRAVDMILVVVVLCTNVYVNCY